MSYNTILATAPLTTQNYHLKMIGTSIGNSLIWDNGTNVGIGTTSPTSILHINSSSAGTQTIAKFSAANYSSPSFKTYIQIGTQYDDGSSRIGSINITGNQSALVLQTHAAASDVWNDAMYINGTGNVGIGTTSSSALLRPLNIKPATDIPQLYLVQSNNDAGGWMQRAGLDGHYHLISYQGSESEKLTVRYDNGNVGIGLTSPSAKLEVSQSASATWSTIVRIAPSTGACYGVLSTIQNQSPNNTSSFLYYGDDTTAARFIVYSNGGIANYTANNNPLSDERLKKEITPLESVWDKVKAIEVVKYKFNDQTHDDFNMGVIAQQVEMVAPELVNLEGWGTLAEDGTPYKSIWENDMNYYTMKALQEAMTKIEEQQIQIQNLQEQINILAK